MNSGLFSARLDIKTRSWRLHTIYPQRTLPQSCLTTTPLKLDEKGREPSSLIPERSSMSQYYYYYYYSMLVVPIYSSLSCRTDPLVHHGRHFGRTVHALCSVSALFINGILRIGELADREEETFTHEYVGFPFHLACRCKLACLGSAENIVYFNNSFSLYPVSKFACWRVQTRRLGMLLTLHVPLVIFMMLMNADSE